RKVASLHDCALASDVRINFGDVPIGLGKMPLQLSAIHRSKGSTAKAKPRRGIGSSDGILALGTWKGAKLRSSETSFPEPTPMLAHYRPPVGSIPDSRTSKSQSRTRSRSAPCLICALGYHRSV